VAAEPLDSGPRLDPTSPHHRLDPARARPRSAIIVAGETPAEGADRDVPAIREEVDGASRLASKLIVILTFLVLIVKAITLFVTSGLRKAQLLDDMPSAPTSSRGASRPPTWQMMAADRRDAAYSVMRTIAAKQGVDRIRMFNKDGE